MPFCQGLLYQTGLFKKNQNTDEYVGKAVPWPNTGVIQELSKSSDTAVPVRAKLVVIAELLK